MNYKKKLFKAEHIRDLKELVERGARLYGDSVLFEQIANKTETETVSFSSLREQMPSVPSL